ncbi:hypothetical protein FRX31_033427, partial [Thalictrum thalictroides]
NLLSLKSQSIFNNSHHSFVFDLQILHISLINLSLIGVATINLSHQCTNLLSISLSSQIHTLLRHRTYCVESTLKVRYFSLI